MGNKNTFTAIDTDAKHHEEPCYPDSFTQLFGNPNISDQFKKIKPCLMIKIK